MAALENRSMQEIIPGLFLGSATAASSLETLTLHAITHVLSIGPFDPLFDSMIYNIINEMDVPETNLLQHFNDTYEFIQGGLDAGGRVLVHCQAGVSRSATVVAAYLMRKRNLPAQQALDVIRDQRPFITPNDGFLGQLDLYYELKYDVDVKHSAYRRYLVDGMAREQQELGYISNLSLTADPEFSQAATTWLRCKKCRRKLVEVDHVLEHQPGKGQQAFSYMKRNTDLNDLSTGSGPVTPGAAGFAVNQPINPLLARIAASRNQCSSYFTEPMEWMGNIRDGQLEGRIDCPKCMAKLGQYNWSGAQCSCGRWITPAFMLHRKQVDEIKCMSGRT